MTTGESAGAKAGGNQGFTQKMLDGIERMGNKVPHPVLMFLYLIILVIVLSHVMYLFGVSATELIAVPVDAEVEFEYYEDTTAPGVIVPEEPYDEDYVIEERTIQSKACSRWRASASCSHPSSGTSRGSAWSQSLSLP